MPKTVEAVFIVFVIGVIVSVDSRPSIRECRLGVAGNDYQGKVNVTIGGLECQRWDSQFPHQHNYTKVEYYPDSSFDDLANYCRNPTADMNGVWCYTTDPNVTQQTCDVPECSDYPECRLSDKGTEYLGFVSRSAPGSKCLDWSSTAYPDEESNYCRNPDGRSTGPWCYVSEDESESCDVPFCKPSASCKRTKVGLEYVGTISWTLQGRVCQRWDTQFPHSHTFHNENFPDGAVTDAQNFCRNPDNKADGPWCFTTDSDTEWDYCQVPICGDYKASTVGRNYFGSIATTTSGYTCQRWDSQSPHPHSFTDPNRFPDASVESASNFCRNPDGKPDGPWCYTNDPSKEWEYCGIQTSKGKSSEDPLVPIANHVVHIGIDGLRPDCIKLAPGGTPNILGRLAEQGTYTLTKARTVLLTSSGPSWGGTMCGMSVERTGILNNTWFPPWMGHPQPITPVTGNSSALPCVFQTFKAQDATIRTAALYDWWWFIWMANKGYAGYVDKEIDCRKGYKLCDVEIANATELYLRNMFKTTERSHTFVYLGEIDFMGHRKGWCGEEYNNAQDVVDAQVGQILDAIEAAGKEDDTVVILSSDHGGQDNDHGEWRDVDLVVPMIIKGPGIKVNHQFESPVDVTDILPTAARILGLKPSPWWSGRIMTEAFIINDVATCSTQVTSSADQHNIHQTVLMSVVVIRITYLWCRI